MLAHTHSKLHTHTHICIQTHIIHYHTIDCNKKCHQQVTTVVIAICQNHNHISLSVPWHSLVLHLFLRTPYRRCSKFYVFILGLFIPAL